MKLKGKNFILKHMRTSDSQEYFKCRQDKEARKGFMTAPKNLKETRKEVKHKISAMKKKKPTGETFVIEIDNEFAGYVEIHHLNEKHNEHKAIIDYCLNKKFRGNGITTKAVKLVTAHAFKKYKLKRMVGWCRTFNKASARTLEKAGYKLEGILRKNKIKDGKYVDDMVWAKIK